MQDGPEGLVASVAMLIAMLSYDTEVAHLFGKDPQTISELILMLVNFPKFIRMIQLPIDIRCKAYFFWIL